MGSGRAFEEVPQPLSPLQSLQRRCRLVAHCSPRRRRGRRARRAPPRRLWGSHDTPKLRIFFSLLCSSFCLAPYLLAQMFTAFVLALAAVVRAQDQPAPPNFIGVWKGTVQQTWGQVGPSIGALECLNTTLSQASTLIIQNYPFTLSGHPSATTTAGANIYVFPSFGGLNGTWAAYTGTTASVRTDATTLVCLSMQRKGSTLTTVFLGGAGFSVEQQCSPAANTLVPNSFTQPYCKSLPGSRSPYQSTVLGLVLRPPRARSTSTLPTLTPPSPPSHGARAHPLVRAGPMSCNLGAPLPEVQSPA